MKKMLLAFAVMACAAAAQAITFNWTTTTANNWYETADWTCSLVYSETGVDLGAAAEVAYNGTTAKGYTFITSAAKDAETQSVLTIDNAYDNGWISTPANYSAVTDAGTYFLIFNKGTEYYASSVSAAAAKDAWTATAGSIGSTITSAPLADFQKGTVPEPTALALLALGVAGLALRRRA